MQGSDPGPWVVGARTLHPPSAMTEKNDDMKLISAIEHAARSFSESPPLFLHRDSLYAFGEGLTTAAVGDATHQRGSASAQLDCRDYKCARLAAVLNADLRAVVDQTLGKRARQSVPFFGTLLDLQLAMVEYPLIIGSAEELAWYAAETNALRQIRPDAPAAARARLLSETRSRAVQELRRRNNPASDLVPSELEDRRIPSGPTDLLRKREGKSIESFSALDRERIMGLWKSAM